MRRLRHFRRSVRSQACALNAGRLVGLASLNCLALILGIKSAAVSSIAARATSKAAQ